MIPYCDWKYRTGCNKFDTYCTHCFADVPLERAYDKHDTSEMVSAENGSDHSINFHITNASKSLPLSSIHQRLKHTIIASLRSLKDIKKRYSLKTS